MSEKPKRQGPKVEVPRTFMSRAYVEEAEPGTFLMYRDVLVETDERDLDGELLREKVGKRIGPMMRFRIARDAERVDFQTSRPDGTVLMLHRVDAFPNDLVPGRGQP